MLGKNITFIYNVSEAEDMMVRSSLFFTFTFWAKSFIILAATFAIVIAIFCFTLLNVKPNLLRGLICLVTLVFLFVMLLAWKLLTTSSKRNARPPNQVLVRALGYDFSHFQPLSLPVRPPPMRSQDNAITAYNGYPSLSAH
uniref:GDT1 family protein n=1 Tax=Heterorhabditis bacteriophora TaxID=37862 RepID=A0A1I7WZX3_HETBA